MIPRVIGCLGVVKPEEGITSASEVACSCGVGVSVGYQEQTALIFHLEIRILPYYKQAEVSQKVNSE